MLVDTKNLEVNFDRHWHGNGIVYYIQSIIVLKVIRKKTENVGMFQTVQRDEDILKIKKNGHM